MKKLIYLSAILVLQLISCKKDNVDIPIGTIKVEIGGSTSTFNIQANGDSIYNGNY